MKILVVEDEHKLADAIKRGLTNEAYAVDVVYDGEQGLAYALDPSYDVIILDRMLPGKDGVAICQALQKQRVDTPVLMLTALGRTAEKVEGLNAGADDYMGKPFAFEELLARVRALLRRPSASLGTTLCVDDLTIDTVNQAVIRAGQAIRLTAREYALLEYMARSPGKLLTKEKLMNHAWNDDADILPNTIEVYIGYLRNKIDRPFPDHQPLIGTVRGFGYMFGAKN